jgi:lipoprotein YgeR
MKNCSFFIFIIIALSACAVKHSPAPIEYKHGNSKLHGVASEETIAIIDPDGEIISTSKETEDATKEDDEYIDDENYIMPKKLTSSNNDEIIQYEVQNGDNIESISAKYGQRVEEIARMNDLYPPYYLDEFQILKIRVNKLTAVTSTLAQDSSYTNIGGNKSYYFIKPVDGDVIVKFGEPTKYGVNKGINIASPLGSVVKASATGKVIYADYDATFGNLVMIKADNKNIVTAYAHLKNIILSKGSAIKQGSIVGYVGSTGKVDGKPQLHFAIRDGKNAIDPLKYIEK